MPKQTRWNVKRKLDQAVGSISKAQDYIVEVGSLYEEHHPDLYHTFCKVISSLEFFKSLLLDLRDKI